MNIPLREGDLDTGLTKGLVNQIVHFTDHGQTVIQVGQVTTEDQVKRTVAEAFKGNQGSGVDQDFGMILGDLCQGF